MKTLLIAYVIGCFSSLLMSIIHIIKIYREDGHIRFTLSHLALLFILIILSYFGFVISLAKFTQEFGDEIVIFEKHRKRNRL